MDAEPAASLLLPSEPGPQRAAAPLSAPYPFLPLPCPAVACPTRAVGTHTCGRRVQRAQVLVWKVAEAGGGGDNERKCEAYSTWWLLEAKTFRTTQCAVHTALNPTDYLMLRYAADPPSPSVAEARERRKKKQQSFPSTGKRRRGPPSRRISLSLAGPRHTHWYAPHYLVMWL